MLAIYGIRLLLKSSFNSLRMFSGMFLSDINKISKSDDFVKSPFTREP